jgi:hypothetical protein
MALPSAWRRRDDGRRLVIGLGGGGHGKRQGRGVHMAMAGGTRQVIIRRESNKPSEESCALFDGLPDLGRFRAASPVDPLRESPSRRIARLARPPRDNL